MANSWTENENRAIVADYFDMLTEELRGAPYNKTEHRRQLMPHLNARPHGSIERKHMNISAILIELGLPYIDGLLSISYKCIFQIS